MKRFLSIFFVAVLTSLTAIAQQASGTNKAAELTLWEELVNMIGDDTYMGMGGILTVADDGIYFWGSHCLPDRISVDDNTYIIYDDSDWVNIRFYVQDGAINRASVFTGDDKAFDLEIITRQSQVDAEAELVALMGDASFIYYYDLITVEDGHIIVVDYNGERPLLGNYILEKSEEGDNFKYTFKKSSGTCTFSYVDGELSVDYKNSYNEDHYVKVQLTQEYAELLSLVGDKKYQFDSDKVFVSHGVLKILGRFCGPSGVTKVGDDYLCDESDVRFVVEQGAIAHVYRYYNGEIYCEFYDVTNLAQQEAELAALIGDMTYNSPDGSAIYAADGRIVLETTNDTYLITNWCIIMMDGDNYTLKSYSETYVFVEEDGHIVRVDYTDPFSGHSWHYLLANTVIAQITIDGTTTDYMDLVSMRDAICSIDGSASIKIFTELPMENELSWSFPSSDADVTLDLNGHTIYGNISTDGSLTVDDSSEEQSGKIVGEDESSICLWGNGLLTINGGTFESNSDCIYVSKGSVSLNGGKFIINTEEYRFLGCGYNAKLMIGEGKALKFADGTILETITFKYNAKGSCEVIDYNPIAQITIGEETTKYTDVVEFASAFEEVNSTATVKLLDDITLPEDMTIYNDESGADITLDLNGHNIKGSVDCAGVIEGESSCTIIGTGVVEFIGEGGAAFGAYGGSMIVNEGTYISVLYVCYVTSEATIVINNGKFKAPALYFYDAEYNRPIVYGGIFSMDPSDCVAKGYEVVPNDDEETMEEYPYKVVESASTPTAIERINAEKAQKAVKTIENGKVVIIRGDKKYDLSGREL